MLWFSHFSWAKFSGNLNSHHTTYLLCSNGQSVSEIQDFYPNFKDIKIVRIEPVWDVPKSVTQFRTWAKHNNRTLNTVIWSTYEQFAYNLDACFITHTFYTLYTLTNSHVNAWNLFNAGAWPWSDSAPFGGAQLPTPRLAQYLALSKSTCLNLKY